MQTATGCTSSNWTNKSNPDHTYIYSSGSHIDTAAVFYASTKQTFDELSECADVMAVETRMPVGVALLQRPDYADAAVSEYFFNGTDRSRCLAKQPVPWPWSSRCSYHSSFLPPQQRLRPCRHVVIHHGIYHAVKQPLQRSWDIAPVTRCPYNYTVMLA